MSKLSILICDDEKKVCKLIMNLIEWDTLDLELCKIVHSGSDALEEIYRSKPDIVITDIRMPDFDGLYLIQKTMEHHLNTQFVIISGYSHFEYAQTALRLGIADYLLKPINSADLNRSLRNIIQNIHKRQQLQNDQYDLQNRLDYSIEKIQEYQANAILFHEPMTPLDKLLSENSSLQFHNSNFFVAILIFDVQNPESTIPESVNIAISKTIGYLKQNIPNFASGMLFTKKDNCIYCIINYDRMDSVQIQYFEMLLHESRKYSGIFDGIAVTLALGEMVSSYELIRKSLSTAVQALHSRISMGVNRVIDYNHISQEIPPAHLSANEHQVLNRILTSLDSADFLCFVQNVFGSVKSPSHPESYFTLSKEIFFLVRNRIGQEDMGAKANEKNNEFDQLIQKLWNREQLIHYLSYYFEEYVSFMHQKADSSVDLPIRQAIAYVEEHYREDCSLITVADYIHLTPSYFSAYFKQKIGVNFKSYVTQYRMDIAKEMLQNTTESVQDIGKTLTYDDPKHFRNLFKKYVGISPSQYRNIYQ